MTKLVKEKFKGRGNSWLKVDINDELSNKIKDIVKEKEEAKNYIKFTEREGFYWVRYKKTLTDVSLFEVRYKGCVIDHPEDLISIPNEKVLSLSLLGNTPKKLQLEEEVKSTLNKKVTPKKIISKRKANIQEKYNMMSNDERLALAFDTQFHPTKPVKYLPLPTKETMHRFELFLQFEGLK